MNTRLPSFDEPPSGYNPLYSKWVRKARLILPIVATIIVAVIIFWMGYDQYQIEPAQSQKIKEIAASSEVLTPQFDSLDSQGRPFRMRAQSAEQDPNNSEIVNLENPKGEFELSPDELISGQAVQGVYDQEKSFLNLKESVKITHSDGYVLRTETLDIDVDARNAQTDQAVFAEGPEGTIEARGMDAKSAQGVLIFTGPATLILHDNGETDLKILP